MKKLKFSLLSRKKNSLSFIAREKKTSKNVDEILFYFQSPSFKFSRKASSSYSLKLDQARTGAGGGKAGAKGTGGRRKPVSTPASPSRAGGREPQCTCMTAEQYARLRAQDPRFRANQGHYFIYYYFFYN